MQDYRGKGLRQFSSLTIEPTKDDVYHLSPLQSAALRLLFVWICGVAEYNWAAQVFSATCLLGVGGGKGETALCVVFVKKWPFPAKPSSLLSITLYKQKR